MDAETQKGLIKIRNFNMCSSADIVLEDRKINLIAGDNAQGKTSILTACRAALTATLTPDDGTKNDGKRVKKGTDKATVVFTWQDDHRLLTWGPKTSHIEGDAPIISAYSAGAKSLLKLEGKERAVEILKLIKADPTFQEFDKAVIDSSLFAGDYDKSEWFKDTKPDKALRNMDFSWETAWKEENQEGIIDKRKFQEITGLSGNWGADKLDTFRPVGSDDIEDGDTVEALSESIKVWTTQREEELKRAAAQVAVAKFNRAELEFKIKSGFDLEPQLTSLKDDKAGLEGSIATGTALLQEHRRSLDRLQVSLEKPKRAISITPSPIPLAQCVCPDCKQVLYINCKNGEQHHLTKSPPKKETTVFEEEPEAILAAPEDSEKIKSMQQHLIDKIAEQEKVVAERNAKLLEVVSTIKEKQVLLSQVEDAKKQLHNLEAAELAAETALAPVSAEDLAGFIDSAQRAKNALELLEKAKACDLRIRKSIKLQELLGPEGLRKAKLEEALRKFNETYLLPQSNSSGWGFVEIQPDFSITYDGMEYSRISKSQKWRCRLMMQIAIAKLEKDGIILIDDAEILVGPAARGKVLNLIIASKLAAIICIACTTPTDVPNLEARGFGQTLFVVDGKAEAVKA